MIAYYNEIDPYCVQWLKNLIAAGHIAPGEVDNRSITEVDPDDLKGYVQAHFFAGIGGWSLALRLAGWPDDRPVWTGSAPCQPFSVAGKQGAADDKRHLWPSFFRLISERSPSTIFGEQVASKVGRTWLSAVCLDLEGLGYACGAAGLPACSVGAPHIRQRLWWVADSSSEQADPADKGRLHPEPGSGSSFSWLADSGRSAGQRGAGGLSPEEEGKRSPGEYHGDLPDGSPDGSEDVDRLADPDVPGRAHGKPTEKRCGTETTSERGSVDGLADCLKPGLEGQPGDVGDWDQPGRVNKEETGPTSQSCELSRLANSEGERRGELQDESKEEGSQRGHELPGERRGLCSPWASPEYLPCRDGKARPTQPGLSPLAHGIPGRVGRLRAYGNAIVPQVAEQFVRAFLEVRP